MPNRLVRLRIKEVDRNACLVLDPGAVIGKAATEAEAAAEAAEAPTGAVVTAVVAVEHLTRPHGIAHHAICRSTIDELDAPGRHVGLNRRAQTFCVQGIGVGRGL